MNFLDFPFQLTGGLLFTIGLYAQTQRCCTDTLFTRLILGAILGFIYLSAIIERLQINLSLFTFGFTVATIILCIKCKASMEIVAVTFTLIYGLIAMALSTQQMTVYVNTAPPPTQINVNNLKALIFLTGAKLLTIFCYFLPFACVVWRRHFDDNNIMFSNGAVTVINYNSTMLPSSEVNHLIVLFSTRFILGTITIFCHQQKRRCVNYLSVIYSVVTTVLAIFLLIAYCNSTNSNDLMSRASFDAIVIYVYITFSLFVDVIGHRVILINDFYVDANTKTLSLVFATFIEHLVDVIFIVIYLNDFVNSKLVLTSLGFVCLTVCVQCVVRSPLPVANCFESVDKQQI